MKVEFLPKWKETVLNFDRCLDGDDWLATLYIRLIDSATVGDTEFDFGSLVEDLQEAIAFEQASFVGKASSNKLAAYVSVLKDFEELNRWCNEWLCSDILG